METNINNSIQESKLEFEKIAQNAISTEENLEIKDYNSITIQTRKMLSDKIKGNTLSTALEILRIYLKNNNYKSNLQINHIITHVSSLATLRNVNVRTINNHIHSLIKCGFISNYFRANGGIIIYLNNDFLYANQKNLPPLVQELQEPLKNNKDKNPREHFESVLQNPREHSDSCRSEEKAIQADYPQELVVSLEKFWALFQEKFYKSMVFTEFEVKETKNLIWESVYKKFKIPPLFKSIEHFENNLIERMDILCKYLNKAPNERFLVHPVLYFDINNSKNSFSKTETWWMRKRLLKIKLSEPNKDNLSPYFRYNRILEYVNKLEKWQLENDIDRYCQKNNLLNYFKNPKN